MKYLLSILILLLISCKEKYKSERFYEFSYDRAIKNQYFLDTSLYNNHYKDTIYQRNISYNGDHKTEELRILYYSGNQQISKAIDFDYTDKKLYQDFANYNPLNSKVVFTYEDNLMTEFAMYNENTLISKQMNYFDEKGRKTLINKLMPDQDTITFLKVEYKGDSIIRRYSFLSQDLEPDTTKRYYKNGLLDSLAYLSNGYGSLENYYSKYHYNFEKNLVIIDNYNFNNEISHQRYILYDENNLKIEAYRLKDKEHKYRIEKYEYSGDFNNSWAKQTMYLDGEKIQIIERWIKKAN